MSTPILTIDGPSGSGKGTISRILAMRLGWRYLDSGALYRVLALSALTHAVAADEESRLLQLTENRSLQFLLEREDQDHRVLLNGVDVTAQLRTEQTGNMASKVASIQSVREALLNWQRDFAEPPGLVADGRDMGTVVFPQAACKIFLTASLEERVKRRYNQLNDAGVNVSLSKLSSEIQERDTRDANRAVAPLKQAQDAVLIDSTGVAVDQVVAQIRQLI